MSVCRNWGEATHWSLVKAELTCRIRLSVYLLSSWMLIASKNYWLDSKRTIDRGEPFSNIFYAFTSNCSSYLDPRRMKLVHSLIQLFKMVIPFLERCWRDSPSKRTSSHNNEDSLHYDRTCSPYIWQLLIDMLLSPFWSLIIGSRINTTSTTFKILLKMNGLIRM
jgi:hypothetical protein